jgi:ParB-like chromosome segregation protein Spo0J
MSWNTDRVAITILDERYAELRLIRPDVLEALRRSIARNGVLQPIVVNRLGEDPPVVLDGFKRLQVVRERGDAQILVRFVGLEEAQAKAAILTYNTPHRALTELEEGWIVRSLCRRHGMKQTTVAGLLGRHKSWVCRRLALAERLDAAVQDDMRLGLVSPTVARELVKLPRGNQSMVAVCSREHELAARKVAKLVRVLLSCDDAEAQKAILKDPVPFLNEARFSPPPEHLDPRLTEEAEHIRQSIVRLDGALLAFGYAVGRGAPCGLGTEDADVLQGRVQSLATRLSETHEQVFKWMQLSGMREPEHVRQEEEADLRSRPALPER